MAMLYVFYQGQLGGPGQGQMFYQRFDGNTWYGIQSVAPSGKPIGTSCAPSPVVWNGGLLQVFHQGAYEDGKIWSTYTKDGLNWSTEQQPIPNVGTSFSPATVVFNNKLYVFHPGNKESGELWYTIADGTSWSKDQLIIRGNDGFDPSPVPAICQSPSAVVWNNVIYVFFQNGLAGGGIGNPGSGGLFFVASTDGKGWENVDGNHQPTRQLTNVGMSFSPSAVVWRNMIHVFHEGYQEDAQLWYSYHDGQNWHADQQVPGVSIGSPASGPFTFGPVPMSPAAVVFNNNCYVFYLNAQQNLSYKVANGTSWSNEGVVPNVPTQCGYVGCVVF